MSESVKHETNIYDYIRACNYIVIYYYNPIQTIVRLNLRSQYKWKCITVYMNYAKSHSPHRWNFHQQRSASSREKKEQNKKNKQRALLCTPLADVTTLVNSKLSTKPNKVFCSKKMTAEKRKQDERKRFNKSANKTYERLQWGMEKNVGKNLYSLARVKARKKTVSDESSITQQSILITT